VQFRHKLKKASFESGPRTLSQDKFTLPRNLDQAISSSMKFVGCYLGQNCSENQPIPLNSLFPEDTTDSDEDVADELDEFFLFMIWNDFSGEEEEEKSSFIEDEEL
jgi:hypothetical protein